MCVALFDLFCFFVLSLANREVKGSSSYGLTGHMKAKSILDKPSKAVKDTD